MPQEDKPHGAILYITYEVHRKLANGQFSGSPIESGKKVVRIDGQTLEECKSKLDNKLRELS